MIMGDRRIAHLTRIGIYELLFDSGVRIDLIKCCYSSEMTSNLISFNAFFRKGFRYPFDDNYGDFLVYKDGSFMLKAYPCNGVYETVMCE